MQTNDVLTQATERAGACATGTQAWKDEQVRLVREEISVHVYEEAKGILPRMERTIESTYRPFLNGVNAVAQRAGVPMPSALGDLLVEMARLCETAPRQLRDGLHRWEDLTFQSFVWKDGRSIDVNERVAVLTRIRQLLRSHDGMASRLRHLKGQVETCLKEWPHVGPRAEAPAIPAIPPPTKPAPVVVETEFPL